MLGRRGEKLLITDTLESSSEHACRLAFHLGPQVACNLEGSRAYLRWISNNANYVALFIPAEALVWKAVRAQNDPPLGWYSPSFGVKLPSTCLLGVDRLAGGASLMP